jgi:nucleoside transporter
VTSHRAVAVKLSVMMFLQYAVWGAWLPSAALYLSKSLGFSGAQIGMILGLAGSIGAVAAPFVAGQFADRYFRTERFLAALLAIGAAINWTLANQTSYAGWLSLSIVYGVVFMPTLALSNSLAFAHLRDAERQFPRVRVFGTIGWIAASWAFPMIWLQENLRFQALPPFLAGDDLPNATARLADSLRFSAGISAAYALFCLMLPATPPKKDGVEPLAFAKALALLKHRSFLVLVLVSLPISVIHNVYFQQTSKFLAALGVQVAQIGPAMTIGQVSEILVLGGLGAMLARLGFRVVITIGALAYFVRYLVWSQVGLPTSVLVASQALHGVCYACFFAAGYIYVDRVAEKDVRHSAQTVFGILILGGGPVIGGWLSGWLEARYQHPEGGVDYAGLWFFVSLVGLSAAAIFSALFRDGARAVGSGRTGDVT